ncbi:MAG: Rne/Rng family ribonuclease [Synergistaceae bacterium]|nr:Rne/Rng family ribonuclease [Synergistaceae bacterium]
MKNVKIIANLLEHEQSRVAVLENGRLSEIFIEFNEASSSRANQGDIFKARVETVLPAISAAFLTLGNKSNAFMFTGDAPGIKPGNELIVQVIKNATKKKSPKVTPNISLPGRWLVLLPDSQELGVSRRINDPSERKRLKDIADTLKSELPSFGVIIRTAAEGIPEDLLRSDLASLLTLWNDINTKSSASKAPCILYRDNGILGRVLRDEVSGSIDEIIIDCHQNFRDAENFIERFYPERPNVTLYEGVTPLFEFFGIEDEISAALERKVWLKSGAYLVIDQTEALTVIDVNTGKFTTAPDMRHTILSTNKEAAGEIARQLRLREIGGIVIVDFIDMDNDNDRNELLHHFGQALSHDRLKPRIFSLTQLGLVELTRKRERPDLKSILTRPCHACGDNGFVEREENIALTIKRFIRKVINSNNAEAFVIQASSCMTSFMKNYLEGWQDEFGRKIFIEPVPEFPRRKFRLKYQGSLEGMNELPTLKA